MTFTDHHSLGRRVASPFWYMLVLALSCFAISVVTAQHARADSVLDAYVSAHPAGSQVGSGQCVALVNGYLDYRYGFDTAGSGHDYASGMAHGSWGDSVFGARGWTWSTDTNTNDFSPGDVLVWYESDGSAAGHTAIWYNENGHQMYEQNGTGANTLRVFFGQFFNGGSSSYAGRWIPPGGGTGGNGSGGYESAFQANTGSLHVQGDLANADLQQGMAGGTSPGVAVLSSGGYETAFQANTGNLFIKGNGGSADTQQGMASGTSPAIAASPRGGFEIAFQANTGNMYTFSSTSGALNRQQGMAAGTSPAIAALPGGGYEMAFQANTGDLFVYGDAGGGDTHQGMKAGTSPSIAASPDGGFEVAFQANTGEMYTYASAGGASDRQQGMDNTTSPVIAALPGSGYEMAFQANTGDLFVYGDAGGGDTHQGMKAGTSPAIAASATGGFEAMFQANTGNMFSYRSNGGPADLQQGMDNLTSPCVSSALGGGCAPSAPISPSSITTTAMPKAVVGKPVTTTLTAAGGSDPYTWSLTAGALPAGLSLTTNGIISGTPRTAGSSTFTVQITDALDSRWTQSRALAIGVAAIGVRTRMLPVAHKARSYRAVLTTWGARKLLVWKITGGHLPVGLTLSKSGVISGKPTKAGAASFTVEVLYAKKDKATRRLSIKVA